MTEDRKLLEPITTVVSLALRLLTGVVVAGFVFTVTRGGWSDAVVCVTDSKSSSSGAADVFTPEKGAEVGSVPRYCATDPSTYQRLLDHVGGLLSLALLAAGLLLLNRLLQGAAKEGVYTLRTASRLRALGWLLLIGSLMAATVQAGAEAALLATLAQDATFSVGSWFQIWEPPYLALFTAVGLVTFARIIRVGTRMQEDLEGVV